MIAHVPDADVVVPASIAAVADGHPVRPVWRNGLGGLTFEIDSPGGRRFVKWAPAGSGLTLQAEIVRLQWAATFVSVPRVIESGSDRTGEWMVTEALPGSNAVEKRWKADPQVAATAIGEGLRALHERLPVQRCSFSWSADDRLSRVRAHDRWRDPTQWQPDHAGLSSEQAMARLADVPPLDRLVVCHGDACAPNTLIGADGRWSGHVDFGALGVADRWADLAVATWSLEWNYGPGWQPTLLAAYGVAPDPQRIAYYRLLWDLSP